jgi:hypothetical protein
MKNRNFWVFLVVLALGWSIWEIVPPTDQDLIEYVELQAQNVDADFSRLIEEARQLREGDQERSFVSLRQAAGTNDLVRYFPQYDISGEADPARVILQRLQRESAGKIKLGLDLQGGTSFLVAMDTNQLSAPQAGRPSGGGGAFDSTLRRAPDPDPDARAFRGAESGGKGQHREGGLSRVPFGA